MLPSLASTSVGQHMALGKEACSGELQRDDRKHPWNFLDILKRAYSCLLDAMQTTGMIPFSLSCVGQEPLA